MAKVGLHTQSLQVSSQYTHSDSEAPPTLTSGAQGLTALASHRDTLLSAEQVLRRFE